MEALSERAPSDTSRRRSGESDSSPVEGRARALEVNRRTAKVPADRPLLLLKVMVCVARDQLPVRPGGAVKGQGGGGEERASARACECSMIVQVKNMLYGLKGSTNE
jgi:hypothetical protein